MKKQNLEYIITAARSEHSDEICNVLIRSITEACKKDHNNGASLQEWLANKTPENVKKWIKSDNIGFVCSHKSIITGFILIDIKGHILLNYVLPVYIGKGCGHALLKKIEDYAQSNGIQQLHVDSTITAHEFYLKNGFIEQYPPRPKNDAQTSYPMKKALKPTP